MQRQSNMLNLFVGFGFQVFNMKTLFYFKLRISGGMIDNLKKEISHLSLHPLEALRYLQMWEFLSRKRCSFTRVLRPGQTVRDS